MDGWMFYLCAEFLLALLHCSILPVTNVHVHSSLNYRISNQPQFKSLTLTHSFPDCPFTFINDTPVLVLGLISFCRLYSPLTFLPGGFPDHHLSPFCFVLLFPHGCLVLCCCPRPTFSRSTETLGLHLFLNFIIRPSVTSDI